MSALAEDTIPTVRFTQRERRGVFLGRSTAQIIIAGGAIIGFVALALLFGWGRVWGLLPTVVAPLVVLGLWQWRGQSILSMLAQASTYRRRAVRGQTKYRRQVWDSTKRTPMPTGTPAEKAPVPVVLNTVNLPGGLGEVQYVGIAGHGGFAYNAKDELAAVTIRVKATAWLLRDDSHKTAAYLGFGGWMSSLEGMPGFHESVLRVRVDRAPSTELVEYARQRDEEEEITVSDELKREYDWLAAAEQARSMEFTSTVMVTFDVRKLNADIRASGGGLAGLATILTERVQTVKDSVGEMGVEFESWLDAEELDAMTTTALDPVTASARRKSFGRSRKELRSRSPIMAGDESPNTVTFDATVHRTMWMHEWPRTKVRVGFVQPILYTGEATRCLAIQFRPIPMHQALNDLGSAQIDMESAERIRLKWGGRTSVAHDREKADLAEREEDLADGFTDARFRAFVTISAPTLADVRRDQASLEQAGYQAGVRMSLLRWQQWPALVSWSLPVPVRGRDKR